MKKSLALGVFLLLTACQPQEGTLRALLEFESWKGEAPGPEQEARLKSELAAVDEELARIVDRVQYKGTLLKAAGMNFLQARMYGPALDYLVQAMAIQPTSPSLYYYAGVAQGNLAKVLPDSDQGYKAMERAAGYHKTALELDEGFLESYYALAVIYGLELTQPEKGLEWIQKYMERQQGVVRGEASSARSYRAHRLKASLLAQSGQRAEAAQVYREILQNSSSEEDRTLAQEKLQELAE